jgi:hypothetical protein
VFIIIFSDILGINNAEKNKNGLINGDNLGDDGKNSDCENDEDGDNLKGYGMKKVGVVEEKIFLKEKGGNVETEEKKRGNSFCF